MNEHDTQPLAAPADLLTTDNKDLIMQTIAEETMRKQIWAATHIHQFTYQLNNAHTALRGCSCGLAFVGLMAGDIQNLKWHQVHEEGE